MMILKIVIIMYCNNHFIGRYWAVLGGKLSGSPDCPDYRGTDCRGTTISQPSNAASQNMLSVSCHLDHAFDSQQCKTTMTM
jgi:hypothetical protein